jgi:exodeoxyribonuclease VII small subunit
MTMDPMTSRGAKNMSDGEPGLEEALARLEAIVSETEKTPPPLEELIGRYEEGVKLLRTCREKLDAAEKRIEIITRDARGNASLEPFDEE